MRESKNSNNNDQQDKVDISVNLGGIQDIFKGVFNFIEAIGRMDKTGQSTFSRAGELKGLGKDGLKGVYGFSVKLGGHGEPMIEKFGNIRESSDGPVVEEIREPITDLFVEESYVLVVSEMPGVAIDEITVELKEDILVISAMSKSLPARQYSKEVMINVPVNPDSLTKHYKNGILEIKLERI